MNEYLSIKTIWLDPTPKIRALHEKSILLVEGDAKSPARLRVTDADPTGINDGKCSVMVWQFYGGLRCGKFLHPVTFCPLNRAICGRDFSIKTRWT